MASLAFMIFWMAPIADLAVACRDMATELIRARARYWPTVLGVLHLRRDDFT